MKTSREKQTGRVKVFLAILLSGGAAFWCLPDIRAKIAGPDSPMIVTGTLPPDDLAEIRRMVRHEMRRYVTWRSYLPEFSWQGLRGLPTAIRSQASKRVGSICLKADGSVEVQTYIKEPEFFGGGRWTWTDWLDKTYKLNRGQNGWQIIQTSWYEHCRG